MSYRFVDEWDENTDIAWRKRGRARLNVAIRAYNDWQRDGFKPSERQRVVATITEARQKLDGIDGGDEWIVELNGMMDFVNSVHDDSLDGQLAACYNTLRDIRQHARYGQYDGDGEFFKDSALSHIESLASQILKEQQ